MKKFKLLIIEKRSKFGKVNVMAGSYHSAIEKALRLARDGKVDWREETILLQHDIEKRST